MSDRFHGYDVSVGYSYTFYREMAPDWLDFCVRQAGVGVARAEGPFRYLELGAGQGLGLCLLAASNPAAEFVGVDFQHEHTEHAESLARAAGLTNVRFVEADFAELAVAWPDDFGTFDYVALHGVLSWVSAPLREAVMQCISQGTHPGSIVYAGYNSQPSWLGMVPFQHIAHLIKETTGAPGATVIDQSIKLFDRLRSVNAPGFQVLPALTARLQTLKEQDSSYAIHEYLNRHWQPLWHSEVSRGFAQVGLDFVGSATMADNLLPDILGPQLCGAIIEQPTEELRQDVQDFALNQSFRRDIFCRRPARSAKSGPDERLCLLVPPAPDATLTVQTSFGTASLDQRSYGPIVEALTQQPMSIEEIAARHRSPVGDVRQVALLLLESNAIGIVAAGHPEPEAAQRINAVIARAVCDGAPYEHVAAASLGSAVRITQIELLLIDSWLKLDHKSDVSALATAVGQRLNTLGQKLYHQGHVVGEAEEAGQLQVLASAFLTDNLPLRRQQGVLQ